MWVSVLMTYPATIAIMSETFGQYLLEGLRQYYDIDEDLVPTAQKLFGFVLLCMSKFLISEKLKKNFRVGDMDELVCPE
jgi:hypothetical protein